MTNPKQPTHLSPPPSGAGSLIAWHKHADIASYQHPTTGGSLLVVDGQATETPYATQLVVASCNLTARALATWIASYSSVPARSAARKRIIIQGLHRP